MKRSPLLALVLVIGCVTGAAVSQVVVPPVRAGTNPTRWEYLCKDDLQKSDKGLDAAMNALGAAGWELAAANHQNASFGYEWTMCFKRPLP